MAAITQKIPVFGTRDRPGGVPPRLTLLFFAMPFQLLAEALYWVFGRDGNLFVIGLSMALWLVWFSLIFLMAVPAVDRWLLPHLRALKRGALVISVLLAAIGIGEIVGIHLLETGTVSDTKLTKEVAHSFHYNDATAMSHQASEMLLKGENPYAKADIVAALDARGLPATTVTPLQQGDFADVFPYPSEEQLHEVLSDAKTSGDEKPLELESKISYPAGSFLFQTPLVALGLKDLRIFYLICAIAAAAIVLWRAPSSVRPLVVAAFLVSLALWNLVATGTIDTLYVMFILFGWMLRSRWWLGAVFMGLAAATKQTAWVYGLFFLILMLRETGWRSVFQSAGVMTVVFAAVNVPFIFGASQHWMGGVMAPVLDPMFPRGVGVVTFSVAGILPPNALIFTLMEIVVLALAAIWYYRTGYRYPHVGLLLAVLPFFFAWRSYSCYFYFASLLVFGLVAALECRGTGGPGICNPIRSWHGRGLSFRPSQ